MGPGPMMSEGATEMTGEGEDRNRELVFSRVFAAPATTVYSAWTDPDKLVHWWGPRGFSLTIEEMDVKVGGAWVYTLHGPDGTDYPNRAVFEVVDPPRCLVFFNTGGHVDDRHLTCRMTVTFQPQEVDGARALHTLVTLRMAFETVTACERAQARGAGQGGRESFARLSEWLDT